MHSHSIAIQASTERVFQLYADVTSWPAWDPDLVEVSLPEGLIKGSTGWLRAQRGPRARITVAESSAARSFTVRSHLPGCSMFVTHRLQPEGSGCRATHSLSFTGPLSGLFRLLLGARISGSLPAALQGLKRMSEQQDERCASQH